MSTSMLIAGLAALSGAAALQLPARAAPASRMPAVRMQSFDLPPDPVDPRIEELVNENKVMLFMKGNKMFPQCGFSNTVVQILNACETPFETFDVLGDERIRNDIKRYSSWPTIPQARSSRRLPPAPPADAHVCAARRVQIYVEGEFLGGCDVMIEMYQSGELQEILEKANAS